MATTGIGWLGYLFAKTVVKRRKFNSKRNKKMGRRGNYTKELDITKSTLTGGFQVGFDSLAV